jgi:hypothetical protein
MAAPVTPDDGLAVEAPTAHPAAPVVDEAHRKKGMLFVGLAVAFVGFGMAMQMGLNANFLADDPAIKASWLQAGVLEAFRESCGILALGVLAVLAGFAEPIVAFGMLLLFCVGISSYYAAPDYMWVVMLSMVWSMGLHVWMPLPNSITLSLAEKGRSGHRLGQISASGAAGFGLGLLTAWVLTVFFSVPMRPLYLVAGVAVLIAAAMCLGIPRSLKTPGPRLVFKRRYALYYVLNFLEGWRKQISMCFGAFLLTKIYGVHLSVMLLLWAAAQAISYFTAPPAGRLIDRIGERRVLVIYYAALSCFFVGYATIPVAWVLCVLFVVDNCFGVLAMSITTYVGRVAPRGELTPTLSMGVAMNHVSSVAMPLLGAVLGTALSYKWTFLLGLPAAALSITASLRIPRHLPHPHKKVPEAKPQQYN